MKKFGFIKKVTAAATAAAMVASLGISAFADTVGIAGVGISITDVDVQASGKLYDVTVTYAVDAGVTNDIGVTMLAYGLKSTTVEDNTGEDNTGVDKTGVDKTESLDSSSDTYADKQYVNDNTMRIIGIDQKTQGADENKFTFKVTTDSANSNGYYIEAGRTALVAVSGDAVTTPAIALLTFRKQVTTAAEIVLPTDGVTADKSSNGMADTLKAAAKAAAEATVKGVVFTAGEPDYTDGEVVCTATIPAGQEFSVGSGVEEIYYKTTSEVTKTVNVAVSFDQVAAASATGRTINIQDSELSGGVTADTLKAYLEGLPSLTFNVVNGDVTDTLTVTPAECNISVSNPTDEGTTKTATATVTLKSAGETENGILTVDTGVSMTIPLSVSSKTPITTLTFDQSFTMPVITVEVENEGDAVTIEKITSAMKEAVISALANAEVGYDSNDSSKTLTFSSFNYEWDTALTGDKLKLKITGFADGVAQEVTENYMVGNDCAVPITVNKTVKPAGDPVYLGDVNMDGRINGQDWQIIMNHLSEFIVNSDLDNKDSVSFKAADINSSGTLNGQDWQAIMNHLSEFIVNNDIGTKVVGYKSVD